MTKRTVEFELKATDRASSATTRAARGVDDVAAATSRYEAEVRDLNFALRSNLITEAEHSRALDRERQKLDQVTQAQKRLTRETAAANRAQLKTASRPVGRFGAFGAFRGVAGMAGGALAAVGLGGLGVGVAARKAVDTFEESYNRLDTLAKESRKLGIDPMELEKLRFASIREGVDDAAFNEGLLKFTKGVSEAAKGTGEAKEALRELHLHAGQLNRLPLAQRLYQVADAMGKIESQEDRLRLTMKLFGESGSDMVHVMNLGADAWRKLADERAKLPGLFSEAELKDVERANDALSDIRVALKGAADEVTVSLAPALIDAAEATVDMFAEFRKWRDSFPDRARGSVAGRREQLKADARAASLPLLRPDLVGRAWALDIEERSAARLAEQGKQPITAESALRARGMTREDLMGIKARADASIARDKDRALNGPSDPIERLQWQRSKFASDNIATANFLAGEAQNKMLAESGKAAAELADRFNDLRRVIPLATRESASEFVTRAVTDPGSLLGILPKLGADAVGALRVPDFIRAGRDESPAERVQRAGLPDALSAVVSRTLRGGSGRVDPAERQVKTLEESVKVEREFVREIRGVRRAVEDMAAKDSPAAGPTGF